MGFCYNTSLVGILESSMAGTKVPRKRVCYRNYIFNNVEPEFKE